MKRWNPRPDDIVSFKHRGLLQGSKKPKHPMLYRLRPDLTWDDVVKSFKENKPTKHGIPSLTAFRVVLSSTFCVVPLRSSVKKRTRKSTTVNNEREIFCKYAEEKGFDPLQAANWRHLSMGALSLSVIHLSLHLCLVHRSPSVHRERSMDL